MVARQVDEELQSLAPASPLFPTSQAGGLSVTLGAGETLATLAKRHYGQQEREFVELIRAANGLSERDVRRLRPGQGIALPAIRRPAAGDAPAGRSVGPDEAGTVPFGQFTFDAEGQEAPGRVTHSRTPHVPTDSSGVTLGRGYDMSKRSARTIAAELTAAGVPQGTAATYSGASSLTGDAARTFARQNRRLELTPEQQWNLFVQEYHRIAAVTQLDILRWELARPAEERIDPAGIDNTTAELLIDLRFRGDLTGAAWRRLRPHLNDAAALGQIMRTRSNFPQVPRDRYERRCRRLGVEPEAEPRPAQQVQRAPAGPDALAGTPAPQVVRAALAGPSQPLAPAVREDMQAQLGSDFAGVKVHTGPLADASARAVGAVAYTVGEHVVFRERAFAPETAAGRQTLAHELVHTTQQAPIGGGGVGDLVVGDPRAPEEHAAQRGALNDSSHSAGPVLRRQTADAPAAASGPTLADVLARAEQLKGLPYAFSEADTVKQLDEKIKGLDAELKKLAKPGKDATAEVKAKYAADKKKIDDALAAASSALAAAKVEHADARVLDVLRQRQVGELSAELQNAVRRYGVVCNVFIELAMRTTGFSDFPVTEQEYVPKSPKYKEVEANFLKKSGGRTGWGLEWADRMVDWGTAHGAVIYDAADPARNTLPGEPRPGDIVLFLRPNGRYHVSMVVAHGDGFNFTGARSSGKSSGTSLTSPFRRYDDKLRSSKGERDLPTVMGQVKYMYILRPAFAATPPPTPAADAEP